MKSETNNITFDDKFLPEILGKKLLAHKVTIAFAESCTGGLATSLLTDIPGSSAYVKGSVVTYSNEAKIKLINVSKANLDTYGAVSEQVAAEMAIGVRKLIATDYGVGITGIAGPDGGSKTKPVGLVYIAVADNKETVVKKYVFDGNRTENKLRSALTAVSMVIDKITEMENLE